MPKSFKRQSAKEHPITEGRTYLAEIAVDPVAYRKIKGHKGTVGQLVKVTAYGCVNIEWASGHHNSVPRGCVKILGEIS